MNEIGLSSGFIPYVRRIAGAGAHAAARVPWLRRPGMRRPLQSAYQWYFGSLRAERLRLFSGLYSDFDSALRAIPPGRLVGYDNPLAARRVANELFQVFSMDYPVLFWLNRLLPQARSLFDWGGHIGLTYFAFRRLLRYPEGLVWTVNDVPAVVEEGVVTAMKYGAAGLNFTTSMAAVAESDILLAAGSLQFIESPLEVLRQQRTLPPHILINKVPIYSMPTAVTLQNMGMSLVPNYLFNEAEFVDAFESLGYRVVDQWETDLSCYIPFYPEHSIPAYKGYFFSRP